MESNTIDKSILKDGELSKTLHIVDKNKSTQIVNLRFSSFAFATQNPNPKLKAKLK